MHRAHYRGAGNDGVPDISGGAVFNVECDTIVLRPAAAGSPSTSLQILQGSGGYSPATPMTVRSQPPPGAAPSQASGALADKYSRWLQQRRDGPTGTATMTRVARSPLTEPDKPSPLPQLSRPVGAGREDAGSPVDERVGWFEGTPRSPATTTPGRYGVLSPETAAASQRLSQVLGQAREALRQHKEVVESQMAKRRADAVSSHERDLLKAFHGEMNELKELVAMGEQTVGDGMRASSSSPNPAQSGDAQAEPSLSASMKKAAAKNLLRKAGEAFRSATRRKSSAGASDDANDGSTPTRPFAKDMRENDSPLDVAVAPPAPNARTFDGPPPDATGKELTSADKSAGSNPPPLARAQSARITGRASQSPDVTPTRRLSLKALFTPQEKAAVSSRSPAASVPILNVTHSAPGPRQRAPSAHDVRSTPTSSTPTQVRQSPSLSLSSGGGRTRSGSKMRPYLKDFQAKIRGTSQAIEAVNSESSRRLTLLRSQTEPEPLSDVNNVKERTMAEAMEEARRMSKSGPPSPGGLARASELTDWALARPAHGAEEGDGSLAQGFTEALGHGQSSGEQEEARHQPRMSLGARILSAAKRVLQGNSELTPTPKPPPGVKSPESRRARPAQGVFGGKKGKRRAPRSPGTDLAMVVKTAMEGQNAPDGTLVEAPEADHKSPIYPQAPRSSIPHIYESQEPPPRGLDSAMSEDTFDGWSMGIDQAKPTPPSRPTEAPSPQSGPGAAAGVGGDEVPMPRAPRLSVVEGIDQQRRVSAMSIPEESPVHDGLEDTEYVPPAQQRGPTDSSAQVLRRSVTGPGPLVPQAPTLVNSQSGHISLDPRFPPKAVRIDGNIVSDDIKVKPLKVEVSFKPSSDSPGSCGTVRIRKAARLRLGATDIHLFEVTDGFKVTLQDNRLTLVQRKGAVQKGPVTIVTRDGPALASTIDHARANADFKAKSTTI